MSTTLLERLTGTTHAAPIDWESLAAALKEQWAAEAEAEREAEARYHTNCHIANDPRSSAARVHRAQLEAQRAEADHLAARNALLAAQRAAFRQIEPRLKAARERTVASIDAALPTACAQMDVLRELERGWVRLAERYRCAPPVALASAVVTTTVWGEWRRRVESVLHPAPSVLLD
jgi:hypothetical protein